MFRLQRTHQHNNCERLERSRESHLTIFGTCRPLFTYEDHIVLLCGVKEIVMDGIEGAYRPRSESNEVKNLNDFEVKIAPDAMNGSHFTNGKANMAVEVDEGAENKGER